MGKAKFDFSGYATRVNLKCSDGRVIKENAFRHNDGTTVPLVWQHQHSDPANVLGHALLENRKDGVYAYCRFNGTNAGINAKELVKHGDITALSIHANQLKQNGADVVHGVIREVSLVMAGANPGAFIENVSISHADGSVYEDNSEALIHSGEEIELHDEIFHDDEEYDEENDSEEYDDEEYEDEDEDDSEEYEDEDEDEDDSEDYEDEDDDEDYDEDYDDEEESVDLTDLTEDELVEILDGLSPEEQEAVLLELAEELENQENDDNVSHQLGGETMKKNVFDQTMGIGDSYELSHADFESILNDAKTIGSFKEAVLQHATTYGIENIDVLFPDAKSMGQPEWLERETEWVTNVLSGCSKTPFSRVKSLFADMNFEEARARGYIKAHEKKETYFRASKRITNPQTVYVKQKLDRDDIIDVTDFDIVAMVRYQLRTLLNEELARAILIGDGRDASDEYKINEENIRPIWTDADLFTIKVTDATPVTDSDSAAAFVEKVAFAHKDYKGSGTPAMYMTPELHTRLLWIKDGMKRRLYNSDAELCAAMRVSKIVEVPHMEGKKRSVSGKFNHLLAIKVNLRDYNCGADKGGQIATFDDFDIDFNQYKYLMETRMSGALTKAYSAQVFEYVTTTLASDPEEELI